MSSIKIYAPTPPLVNPRNSFNTTLHVMGYFTKAASINPILPEKPAGENGFGWDRFFIPEGYTVTRAQLSEEDDKKTYLQIKPFAALKKFLISL